MHRIRKKQNGDCEQTIELFYATFCSASALHENMESLFYMARQELSRIELQADCAGIDVRRNIRQLFDFVAISINRHDGIDVNSLIAHVCGLLFCIADVSLPDHQWLHLCLEVQWGCIETLHRISMKFPGILEQRQLCYSLKESRCLEGDLFYQVVYYTLSGILLQACRKYAQLSPQDWLSVLPGSPFPCACVQELLAMLFHLMSFRQQELGKESFLSVIQRLLQDLNRPTENSTADMEIDCDKLVLPRYECTDPLGLSWWFVSHCVQALTLDVTVVPRGKVPDQTGHSVHFILQDLVKQSCTAAEGDLRRHLRLLLTVSPLLPVNIDHMFTLWDMFSRRLNDFFHLYSGNVSSMPSIISSASQLLDQSQAFVVQDETHVTSNTSFQLFLRLLCLELKKSDKIGPANPEWRAMKGRFYSRFHSRRMQELSELGLQNVALLFLCLAQVADTQELIEKMCEHYSSIKVATLDLRKRCMIWRGSFAAMMVCSEKQINISFLANKLVLSLNDVASKLSDPQLEPHRYNEYWPLIELYTESTQEVLESSPDLDLGQHALVGQGYRQLLNVCREGDLRFLLNFALAVVTKLRLTFARKQHDSIVAAADRLLADALWRSFYPFVRQHSLSETPPPQLADLAVGFAFLLCDAGPSPASGVQESLSGCFQAFACNTQVNAKIVCRFLGHLLPNVDVMEKLRAQLGWSSDVDTSLLRAWIRCSLQLLPSSAELVQLNRLVETLTNTSPGIDVNPVTGNLPLDHFLYSLNCKYQRSQDFKSCMELKDTVNKYFSEVSELLPALVKSCGSSELMANMYQVVGQMVKYCGVVLYQRSQPDCLLPVVIEKLVLPRTLLTPGKQLPAHVTSALRQYLHLYVIGLGRLDFKRDQYVQRKLKDVVIHYLPRFSLGGLELGGSATSVHPLLSALDPSNWCDVEADVSSFRGYLLDVIKSEHLSLRGTNAPQHVSAAWHFVSECLSRCLDPQQVARDSLVLLRTCLDYALLISDAPHLKHLASRVLNLLLEALKNYPQAVERQVLSSIVRAYVSAHVMLYMTRLFKVIELVAQACPEVVCPSISVMTQALRNSELKRGVGADKLLRIAYCNLLGMLGEEGAAEIKTLIQRCHGR